MSDQLINDPVFPDPCHTVLPIEIEVVLLSSSRTVSLLSDVLVRDQIANPQSGVISPLIKGVLGLLQVLLIIGETEVEIGEEEGNGMHVSLEIVLDQAQVPLVHIILQT